VICQGACAKLITTAMIATQMPAAIRASSVTVAADSSFTKRETRVFIGWLPGVHARLSELDPLPVSGTISIICDPIKGRLRCG